MAKNLGCGYEQTSLFSDRDGEASGVGSGGAAVEASREVAQGGAGENKLLITVIIKQAGFYGCQRQIAIEVNPHSHLLEAMDKERARGQEPLEHILNFLAKGVRRRVVSLVSGISEQGSAPSARVTNG